MDTNGHPAGPGWRPSQRSILPTSGHASQGGPLTMSSREIADMLENRHENVKVSIIRLVDRGIIARPAMQVGQFADKLGRPRSEEVFLLDKRSSLIVVAQLSPEIAFPFSSVRHRRVNPAHPQRSDIWEVSSVHSLRMNPALNPPNLVMP